MLLFYHTGECPKKILRGIFKKIPRNVRKHFEDNLKRIRRMLLKIPRNF